MIPLKEMIKRERKAKKEEKALMKKLDQEEKKLELEEEKEQFSFKDIMDVLKNESDLDEELESYLTEEEKISYHEQLNEEKRFTKMIFRIIGGTLGVLIIFCIVINSISGTIITKEIEPLVKDYYKDKFNKKIDIQETYFLEFYNKQESKKEETKIHITKTKDNHHIIGVNKKNLGDDIDNSEVYNTYNELLKNLKFDLISSNPIISYKDYYTNYNALYDYIKVLPNNKTFNELLGTKKLTIRDVIIYQNNININYFKALVNKLSDDSKFILIKSTKGIPENIITISKNDIKVTNVINRTNILEGITNYELDPNTNAYSTLELIKIKGSAIKAENISFKNVYKVELNSVYGKDENKNKYFIIKFDKNNLESKDIALISARKNYDGYYTLLNENEYPEIYFIDTGGYIYVIGTEEISFANTYKKKEGFLCKLGLC